MTKSRYLQSESPEGSLLVGIPEGTMVYFRSPSAAVFDEEIGHNTLVRNIGDTSGRFFVVFYIWAPPPQTIVLKEISRSRTVLLQAGAQEVLYGTIDRMRAQDVVYRAGLFLEDGTWYGDLDNACELITEYDTALAIELYPSSVRRGSLYTASGFLRRSDNGEGIPDQTIMVQMLNKTTSLWELVGTTTTFSNGRYQIDGLTSPSIAGTYQVKSIFLGSALYGKSSATSTLEVDTSLIARYLLPAVAGMVGGVIGITKGKSAVAGIAGAVVGAGITELIIRTDAFPFGLVESFTVAKDRSSSTVFCPVCGTQVPYKPVGIESKCLNCGFISAYSRV